MYPGRLALTLAVLAIALLGQFRLHATFGAAPDLVLAALLSIATFMSVGELMVAVAVAALVLNWQPAPSLEISLMVVLPLVLGLVAHLVSLQSWAANVAVVALGLLLFPLIAAPGLVWAAPGKYIELWFFGIVFGALAFRLFMLVFGKPGERQFIDRQQNIRS